MLQITIRPEDMKVFETSRFSEPHPIVQRKMWTLWLKGYGYFHNEICDVVGISENTLRAYLKEYMDGGVTALKTLSLYQPTSALEPFRMTLDEYFRQHPPATIAQAISEIERLTGVRRKRSQVREFLHRIGMKCRKVGAVPGKADPAQQEDFKKNSTAQT